MAQPALSSRSTANADEIANFTKVAESWWDSTGPFKPLHKFNPVRLAYLREKLCLHFGRDPSLTRPFEGLTLLDIGCGGGLLAEPLTRMGFQVTGIDAGEKNIAVAKIHAEKMGLSIDYRAATPELLQAESFDVVLCMEVVEHVEDVDQFLAAATRLAKPGAAIVAATLNRSAKSYALAIIGAEYILRWVPRGTHDWRKFLKPSELSDHLRRQGVAIREIAGLSYSPISDEWRVGKDLGVNYVILGSKP